MLPKPHSLQTRFLIGLLIMMACVGGLSALSLDNHLRQLMENEARDRASLIMAQAESVQSYVRRTLRPAMYDVLPEDMFVIQAMSSSYVTRAVMSDENMNDDRFIYRRVTEGARNPDFEAVGLEQELVRRFREDKGLSRIVEIAPYQGQERFVSAKPVYFESACLRCHGDPDKAPKALLDLYGRERGFWRETNDLAGITLVALPLDQAVSGMREAVMSFAVLFGCSMLLLFLVIQIFFNRLVVHSIRRMGALMQRQFSGDADAQLFDTLHGYDEIEDLMAGLESVAGHLRSAREQLRQYATNLEGMVETRTSDLTTEALARRADVELFVALLDRLNRHAGKSELLSASLELVAKRFGADRAVYSCVMSNSEHHAWPKGASLPALPSDWQELVTEQATRLDGDVWYIPIQTSETTRGLLSLYWSNAPTTGPRTVELVQAVGRQLGVAMDNVDAMDNLMRQNALLDSIFESISDPLLLLDAEGRPVLTNPSAARLLQHPEAEVVLLCLKDMAAHLRQGGETEIRELALPDGRSFSVHSYAITARPERRGQVIYLRETTEERRMLKRAQQQEKLATVGKLAAGLAHEINNPLGVILCHAELLRDEARGQARADLDMILKHTEQAQKVLRDMLDFSRNKPVRTGTCEINEAILGLADVFRPRLRSQGVSLNMSLSEAALHIRGDRDVLEQILTNILINALDALESANGERSGGTIAISTERGRDETLVRIADTGPGIPEEHLKRVFDPFFTTKEVGRGTGLGLSVVFGLVQDLNGRIEVRNAQEAEGGAEFLLSFPVLDNEQEEPR
ncbi:MAG: DUF3365 domain-containing protein [Desulfomicrobium sp.]|nr:DUF3365 domain-containing protein [Pseudomonadota bacterium]MBV1710494.1 DUF3365 domain-containing protein [Desulfomicrobium sp.]MBU4570102.1 DUF3365 domain-containing protein [Pseudomonadota bacterium]MBU4593021.1 DUF3365 domain-containing protein [Pseudomonadota bacterium]MBV1720832.1 DUF3365 domain-containing protein [Desulfomicrobium sp.]